MKKLAVILCLFALLLTSGCLSAILTLSKESPLPTWFENKTKFPSTDLTFKYFIYENYEQPKPGKVIVRVYSPDGKQLLKKDGVWKYSNRFTTNYVEDILIEVDGVWDTCEHVPVTPYFKIVK
ncbi:MAG: hypothetical protein A2283_21980 [Lentisphaerae bacterium RIFOXYA12_FULL_48_11]|nr:MAG: hypothetical protein A2283_21980 [Lentisphaerae bacterium RIFOXYA12_FULL_48_11]